MAKDLFSSQAGIYAQFRPQYPPELFEYIIGFVKEKKCAWDCATGNGQSARHLAGYFERVEATDISQAQLDNAVRMSNLHYTLCPAEATPFNPNSFDLITVATAYHWLNPDAFRKEVVRVAKKDAVIAIWAYDLLRTDDKDLNQLIDHFYKDITGPYWHPERKLVDERYTTVKFDFAPLPTKDFFIHQSWTLDHLKGYLRSWSAVQQYIDKNINNPLELIEADLRKLWKEGEEKKVQIPLFMRMGRVSV